jgi:SWI/SNF-related matrix-associated actin-dependent regulator of chromatin subfamily A-like protein 1
MPFTKPYQFQRQCCAKIEAFNGRALLAAEVGTGKTIVSLLWAKRNPEARPVIVVCPASLKWNWEREALVHFGVRSIVLSGTKSTTIKIDIHCNLIIINYDILKPWMNFLKELKPKLIIIDESSALGNRSTLRTKMVKALCRNVPYVIALSGTPLINRPKELWPTLNIIRPDEYPSFYPFGWAHCGAELSFWGYKFDGANNLDTLHKNLLKQMMIRVLKKDVLSELPEKQRIIVPLDIENRKKYDLAVKDFIKYLTQKSPAKAERASRAKKLVQMGELRQLAAQLKLKFVLQWIDNFLENTDEKLVVFAIHKEIITALQARYRHICVVIDGSIVGKDRQHAVDQFQNNSKTRLIFGNIKAAGVGITLTAASTIAVIEIPWTPGDLIQIEGRCHRISAKNLVSSYYLIAKNTIEEKLLKIIQDKQEILSATLDGKTNSKDLDVYDLLIKELLKE